MRAVIFSFSERGGLLNKKIAEALTRMGYDCQSFTSARLAPVCGINAYENLHEATGEAFRTANALLFIGACGIAVRHIAPWLKDKTTDPAVLVTDDNGQFIIPILSGHIGGANALSNALADAIGAVSVITTATDVNKRFAADAWAAANQLVISDMGAARAVSAGILSADIPMKCDFIIRGKLPGGIIPGEKGVLGIYISYKTATPFEKTLQLTPRILHIGVGCRKGIDASAVTGLISDAFAENGWDISAVAAIASIDLKSDEAGLRSACEKIGVAPIFYSPEALAAVSGDFTASTFVKSVTGVENVCERAAVLSAGGGRLILKKTARNGVTIAVAEESWEAVF